MKFVKITLIIFLLGCLFVSGCKKYPDGPLISLRSKKHRIVGEWLVDYFSINGYDSTNYVKSLPYFGEYIFSKNEDSDGRCAFSYVSNDHTYEAIGYWEFTSHKEDVFVHQISLYPSINPIIGPYAEEDVTWEIQRLKEDELWLKTTYKNKEYFIKFKH